MLDIGCGLGENTGQWGEKTGLKPIGLERQYHPKWYGDIWRDSKLGARFARADIAEALPMPKKIRRSCSLRECSSAPNSRKRRKTLDNIRVALRDGGLLIIGPQTDEKVGIMVGGCS